jgi:hypothetical protein
MKYAFSIILLAILGFSAPAVAHETPAQTLRKASTKANAFLPQLRDRAQSEGITLTNDQLLFARDLLIGYYNQSSRANIANIVWLRVPKRLKSEFAIVVKLVGKLLDPIYGIEHMRYDDYFQLPPEVLQQKLREQRKHIVVFDDFTKFMTEDTQSIEQMELMGNYWEWIEETAPSRLTLFIIDEEGEIIRDPLFMFHSRINYVGNIYSKEFRGENGATIDMFSTEAIDLKNHNCNADLRRTISWN